MTDMTIMADGSIRVREDGGTLRGGAHTHTCAHCQCVIDCPCDPCYGEAWGGVLCDECTLDESVPLPSQRAARR